LLNDKNCTFWIVLSLIRTIAANHIKCFAKFLCLQTQSTIPIMAFGYGYWGYGNWDHDSCLSIFVCPPSFQYDPWTKTFTYYTWKSERVTGVIVRVTLVFFSKFDCLYLFWFSASEELFENLYYFFLGILVQNF
jgi:hypothetical protein